MSTFSCNILAEFHYLLVDILQEGITWLSSDKHDSVNSTFSQVHGHGSTQSNWVRPNFFLVGAESMFSNCYHSILECVGDVLRRDVCDPVVDHDCRNGGSAVVLGYPLIHCTIAAAAQTGQRFTSPKAICVTVSIFLSFFCFWKVNKMQSENSNSASLWLMSLPSWKNLMLWSQRIVVRCWLAAGTLRYSQDLHAKNIARKVSWETAMESSEIVFFQSLQWYTLGSPFGVSLLGLHFWSPDRVAVEGIKSWHLRPVKGLGSHFLWRLCIHMKQYLRLYCQPIYPKLVLKTVLHAEPRQKLQWFWFIDVSKKNWGRGCCSQCICCIRPIFSTP